MRFVWLWWLAGCGDPITTSTWTDVAGACVEDGMVRARLSGCLSSSCDTVVSAACTATLDGETVVVSGTATIRSQGRECTADCGLVEVDCPLPDGGEAATTLAWDGSTAPIDVSCAALDGL